MMRRLLAILALAPVLAHAQSELVTDFKGVYVGAKIDEEQVKRQFNMTCKKTLCEGKTTIVGASAKIQIVLGLDGLIDVIVVSFSQSDFESVAAGLVAKFGPATGRRTSTVQNSYGAKGENEFMYWNRPDGATIMASERGRTLAEAAVTFSSARHKELLLWNKANNLTDL